MGKLPGILLMGPKCNHKCPWKREAERETGRCHTTGLKDGGRGHEPKNTRNAALKAGKGKQRIGFSREPLERRPNNMTLAR